MISQGMTVRKIDASKEVQKKKEEKRKKIAALVTFVYISPNGDATKIRIVMILSMKSIYTAHMSHSIFG